MELKPKKLIFFQRKKMLQTIMKTLIFFCCLTVFSFTPSNVSSQNTKIYISKSQSKSIHEVFDLIKEQTNYKFIYQDEIFKNLPSIKLKKGTIDTQKLLEKSLEDLNCKISINNETIEIVKLPQQLITINGTVQDETGAPLPGATVLVKGTSVGSQTDFDGKFSLETYVKNPILSISYIGYISQEIKVNDNLSLTVVLKEDAAELDEVLVIGYGTQKKSDLTGAVTSVKSKDLVALPTSSPLENLQGRSAGVQVSNIDSEPGATPSVKIRGITSINAGTDPLYVVDGFVGGTLPQAEDIASMQVLKDASATAIYGARGANGVIIITTKRAKDGGSKVEINTSYSFQQISNRIEMMNASEFGHYINDINASRTNPGDTPYPNPETLGEGTNWFDQITQIPSLQNHHIALSGGDKVRYYVSGKFVNQVGAVKNSSLENYNFLSNLDFNINKNFEFGVSTQYQRKDRKTNNVTQALNRAFKFAPTLGVLNEDGSYTTNSVGNASDINPVAYVNDYNRSILEDKLQLLLKGKYQIYSDLSFTMTLGVNNTNTRDGIAQSSKLLAPMNLDGIAQITGVKNTNLSNEGYFTYNKSFRKLHNFTGMLGYTYQTNQNERWMGKTTNLSSDSFLWWNLGAGNTPEATSNLTDWTLSSYFARLNYNFDSKYYITLTGRADGSSKFGPNSKWAYFPSGALSWTASNEEFLKEVDWLSQLKLRASYGETGNSEIPPYSSKSRLYTTSGMENDQRVNAFIPYTGSNKDLSWESTAQTNFGMDLGLFNNRLSITAEYYSMLTKDLLYEVLLPSQAGLTSAWQNIGEVSNKGIEVSIAGQIFAAEDLQWSSSFNISKNVNKIEKLYGGDIIYELNSRNDYTHILTEGAPLGSFYGYVQDGLYQEGDDFSKEPNKHPGQHKYRDLNNDGQITLAGDRTVIGNPHPDFNFGFNNTINYKNFDFNIFFNGSSGGDIFNMDRKYMDHMQGESNARKAAVNRWSPTNTSAVIPAARSDNDKYMSTYYVEDGSFIRLKNLALGYSLPKNIIEKTQLSRIRFYISGQNLLTWTKYSGLDPEVGYKNSNRFIGVEWGRYPPISSLTLGLNISL